MRILFVNNGLGMGGIEVVTANYLVLMKRRGYDVCFLEFWHKPSPLYSRLAEADIPVYSVFHKTHNIFTRVVNKVLGGIILKNKVEHILHKVNPDIVNLQTYNEKISLRGYDFNKVFFTLHTDLNRFLFNLSSKGRECFKNLITGGMHIIVLSGKSKRDIWDFCPTADVHIVPNGLDVQKIRSEKYDRDKLCNELGIPSDSFILGHVGRFNKIKNHEKLIDIFASLQTKCHNSYLLLIGTGTEAEKRHVHNIVEQHHLQDRVKFMGVRTDATSLMSCFDAFVLPSIQESFSLVLVEAQIQGVRCVASSAVPDEVICNDDCFKLSINEPSEKWADLLLSKSVIKRNKDVNRFDINNVLDELIKLYKDCLLF